MNYRRLSDEFTELLARQLNQQELMAPCLGGEPPGFAELMRADDDGAARYRSDAIFHARVCSLVAGLVQCVMRRREEDEEGDLERDAARYRHMRGNATFQNRNGPGAYWYLPRWDRDLPVGERLDRAVDAGIRETEGGDIT